LDVAAFAPKAMLAVVCGDTGLAAVPVVVIVKFPEVASTMTFWTSLLF
jgi:hypothetical protein